MTDARHDAEETRAEILDLVARYYRERHAPPPFDPGRDPVRYAGRVFGEEEMRLLVDSSLDFYLTSSRFTEEFEAGVADYLGLSDALFVNSGSSANLVALTTLTSPKLGERRLRPGDEVITVAAGFPSTVAPIVQNGLVPVFVGHGPGQPRGAGVVLVGPEVILDQSTGGRGGPVVLAVPGGRPAHSRLRVPDGRPPQLVPRLGAVDAQPVRLVGLVA